MALIECIECKNKISDKAKHCPSCGCPATVKETTKPARPEESANQTVYVNNAKQGKKKIAIGSTLTFLGIFIMLGGGGGLGALMFIGGIGTLIAGRFQNWWHWG